MADGEAGPDTQVAFVGAVHDGDPAPRRGGDQAVPRPIGSRPGGPPPWHVLPEADRIVTVDGLVEAFAAADRPWLSPLEGAGVRGSAVLVALYEHEGDLSVLLTRRSSALRSHSGEMSFPGGGQDPGETFLETALREAREEVDLRDHVHVIGELDHLQTVTSRSFIVPIVGVLDRPPVLTPSPAEVAYIRTVPLRELLLDEVFREERWGLPPLDRPLYFFELFGDTVWGATAFMLRNLLALATGTRWR